MSKSPCRLYPVDVELMPWLSCGPGLAQRVLAHDEDDGAYTRLLRVDAGCDWTPDPLPLWLEMFVLSGSMRSGETVFAASSYVNCGPHEGRLAMMALSDTVVIELADSPGPRMDKATVALTAGEVAALPEVRPEGSPEGVTHRILSAGSMGSVTRLLSVLPFVSTGVFDHDHGEEVLILDGSYKMGDEFHAAGTYTCKGPGVLHGPFLTATGYRGLEFRNYTGRP
jgi:hypothetical protein